MNKSDRQGQNHHVHNVLLSIPIAIVVALLSYRAHYVSVFDYTTNHVHLPWSSSHRSLHPSLPEAFNASSQPRKRASRFHYCRNMAAVAWPRKEMTQESDMEQGSRAVIPGFTGVAEGTFSPSSPRRNNRLENIPNLFHSREAAIRGSAHRLPQAYSGSHVSSTRTNQAVAATSTRGTASRDSGEQIGGVEDRRSAGTIVNMSR